MRGRLGFIVLTLAFVAVACGDSGDPTTVAPPPASTAAPTTLAPTTVPPTTVAVTTTVAPTTTTQPAGPSIAIGEPDAYGVIPVTIDGASLGPLFDAFVDTADPYFHIHTNRDDVFVGAEMYTMFGAGWSGELGTFPTDCVSHGICVYMDPDGSGPLPSYGPGLGEIEIIRLGGEGSIITLHNMLFTDGTDQYSLASLTLTG